MANPSITGTDVEDVDEADEALPATYSITSYGADYPVDSLVKRLDREDILVPKFQRGFVWTLPQASRFVESLLLGLPVPGVFLSREEASQKLIIIDGQQRLRTLQAFQEGLIRGKEFTLVKLKSRFEGATYKGLAAEDRRRLDDSIIHATIIRQEAPDEDDASSIYSIFERLNTGGTPLQPQEIRACIYRGELNDLLRELNASKDWRSVYGALSDRMKDQELILRFFGLYYGAADYKRPMKGFLNGFMHRNRKLTATRRAEMEAVFLGTLDVVSRALGEKAFRPSGALNAAVYDAVTVGLARRLESGAITAPEHVREAYHELLDDESFQAAYSKATADEESVAQRLRLATEAFSTVA